MDKEFILRGVPGTIRRDGWWLNDDSNAGPGDTVRRGGGQFTASFGRGPWTRHAALIALVVLADQLFWRHGAGLSLVVFALAVLAVSAMRAPDRRRLPGAILILGLGLAPLLDYVQILSLAIALIGLGAAVIWLHHPVLRLPQAAQAGLRFVLWLPRRWLAVLSGAVTHLLTLPAKPLHGGASARLAQALRDWGLPLAGAAVFATLFISANPLLEYAARFRPDTGQLFQRGLFWAGWAVAVLPFLAPQLAPVSVARTRRPGWLNTRSTLRALVLFNALIAVQMLSDLSILLLGAQLPEGMNHAEYAHRGAYPLLAAALLAGGFALAARPFLHQHRVIRPLMLLWLGQNLVLAGAAARRLDLYVNAYGLTYLRLYAAIWIALTMAGLALLIWQVARGQSNGWVVARLALLAGVTLYVAAFVNFAAIIAQHNLAHYRRDLLYVCRLGPMAAAQLAASDYGGLDYCGAPLTPRETGWQEWGFRAHRVRGYVEVLTQAEAAHDHPDRR